MAQHDLDVANGSGAAVRADINGALAALGSCMKGPNAPSAPLAGMIWVEDDNPSSTRWTVKMYDGADWIALGVLDSSTNIFEPASTATGLALIRAADKAAGRAAIDAAAIGAIGSSGVTMATARLLGRTTASTGAVEEITVGAGLTLSGGSLSANVQAQTYVQRAYAEYTTSASLSAVIPWDDTVPLSTEGTQILSVTVTPGTTTNRLRARFQGWGDIDGSVQAICAVFAGTTCLAASANNGGIVPLCAEVEYVPGSTSAVTISVRVGPASGGTMRLNGTTNGGFRRFGGASRATLVVEEIVP